MTLVFNPSHSIYPIEHGLGPLSSNIKITARNSAIIFGSELSFEARINKTVQSCFLYLCTISKLKPILRQSERSTVIHKFKFSRQNFCNSLLSVYPKNPSPASNLSRIQELGCSLVLPDDIT